MRLPRRLASCCLAAGLAACATSPAPVAPCEPAALLGAWRVDLRPTPDAAPYFQDFVVDAIDDRGLRGSFYGTAIDNSRINRDWGAVHFAFTTADGSGTYHTSGVLDGDRLRGTTHSLGRDFLAVWTATRR